jgi:hypothetical protein
VETRGMDSETSWGDGRRGGTESVVRARRSYSVFGGGKAEVRRRGGGGSTMRRRGRRREARRGWLQRYAGARGVYNATPFIFAHGSSVFGTPIPPPPILNCGGPSPPVDPVLYDRALPPPASGMSPPPEKSGRRPFASSVRWHWAPPSDTGKKEDD